MTPSRPHRLGDLQLRLLKVLWEQPSASVAEVHQALGPKAGLAYTTIATMLRKMEARGLVAHDTEGRRFLYRAAVTPNAVTRGMADDLLERLFEGRLADLVSHLLSTREVTQEELDELERLIAERKQQP
jgi:BlaI family transcriptional regulator, penicillinase repressor